MVRAAHYLAGTETAGRRRSVGWIRQRTDQEFFDARDCVVCRRGTAAELVQDRRLLREAQLGILENRAGWLFVE